MNSLNKLHFFKEEEQHNDPHPYEHEDAKDGVATCIYYKKVE
jgi:hypothetical protein